MSKKKTDKKKPEKPFYIERKILDYFKESIGDTYKKEIEKEKRHKQK